MSADDKTVTSLSIHETLHTHVLPRRDTQRNPRLERNARSTQNRVQKRAKPSHHGKCAAGESRYPPSRELGAYLEVVEANGAHVQGHLEKHHTPSPCQPAQLLPISPASVRIRAHHRN